MGRTRAECGVDGWKRIEAEVEGAVLLGTGEKYRPRKTRKCVRWIHTSLGNWVQEGLGELPSKSVSLIQRFVPRGSSYDAVRVQMSKHRLRRTRRVATCQRNVLAACYLFFPD
jgi:hypothetical protein